MNRRTAVFALAFVAAVPPAARAQRAGGGGGINYAPRPGLYTVVLVDAKGHRLRVRDVDGKTIDANAAEGAYDLAKLRIGDRIRIDFAAQDAPDKKPTAATIWPAK